MKFKQLIYIILLAFSGTSVAQIKSGFCDPYYASIKSGEVNSHKGPGREYKISFKYIQKGTPVMVVAQYDHWRKVKDPLGDESWIHKNMLSAKRFVIVVSETPVKLMSRSNSSSKIVAYVKKNVVMELHAVRGKWCNVAFSGNIGKYTGWIQKSDVFGVFENEIA